MSDNIWETELGLVIEMCEEKIKKLSEDTQIKNFINQLGEDYVRPLLEDRAVWFYMITELGLPSSVSPKLRQVIEITDYATITIQNHQSVIKFNDARPDVSFKCIHLLTMIVMFSSYKYKDDKLLAAAPEKNLFLVTKYIIDAIDKIIPLKTEVSIKLSVGNYEWCGNNYGYDISGHYLTPYREKSKEQIMIELSTQMSERLLQKIDLIEIYNMPNGQRGFCANYSHYKLSNPHKVFFKLQPEYGKIGESLMINYLKLLPRNPKANIFSRSPMKIIHSEIIQIPDLEIKGSNDCAICLEPADTERYISTCQHIFHSKCIFEYLKATEKLLPLSEYCVKFECGHDKKCKPFECPVCKKLLESRDKKIDF